MRLLIAICLLGLLSATSPNLKASVNESLAKEFLDILMPLACGYLKGYKLGDFDTDLSTKVGTIHMKVTKAVLDEVKLDLSTSKLTFESPNLVSLELNSVEVKAEFDYDFKYGFITEKGHATATASQIDVKISINVETDSTNNLKLNSDKTSVNIGKFELSSDMDKALNGIIEFGIREELDKIEGNIDSTVKQEIEKANKKLAQLDYMVTLSKANIIADAHPSDIKASSSALIGGLIGAITNINSGSAYPENEIELPDSDSDMTEQVQVFINEYMLNSALAALADGPSYTFTSSDHLPFSLTTDGLESILPELKATFGANKPVKVNVSGNPTGTNSVSINEDLSGTATGYLDFKVKADDKWEDAVTLGVEVHLQMTGSLNGATLEAQVSELALNQLDVTDSHVGDVNAANVKSALTELLQMIQSEVNAKLKDYTVTYPKVHYVKISSAQAFLKQGFVALGVSIAPSLLS